MDQNAEAGGRFANTAASNSDALNLVRNSQLADEIRTFMTDESQDILTSSVPPLPALSEDPSRDRPARTPLRIKYEAEASSIQKKIGDLEAIRNTLGLSQRKICQLLLVDPSAWTRWTRGAGSQAPPHIYRSLQWFLAVQEKYPALDVSFWLSNLTRPSQEQNWESEVLKLNHSLQILKSEQNLKNEHARTTLERLDRSESRLIKQARAIMALSLLTLSLLGFVIWHLILK